MTTTGASQSCTNCFEIGFQWLRRLERKIFKLSTTASGNSEDAATALTGANQAIIAHDMQLLRLVVEVVSPQQENRDYRHKRTEYAGRHIAEYWIVDPIAQKVTVLEWVDGLYEEQVYQGEAAIASGACQREQINPQARTSFGLAKVTCSRF